MVPLFFNTIVVSACAVAVLTCVTTFFVAVTVVIAMVPPYAAVASERMTIGLVHRIKDRYFSGRGLKPNSCFACNQRQYENGRLVGIY